MLVCPGLLSATWSNYRCVHPTLRADPNAAAMTDVPKLTQDELRLLGDQSGLGSSTYGEITSSGFQALMASCELAKSDAFVDLGSGRGSCVLQAVREYHVHRACGIELAPSRHALAIQALAAAEENVQDRTRFIEGDAAAPSVAAVLDEEESTVVYCSNLLFDEPLMRSIAKRLAAAHSVRCVAALRPIAALDGFVVDEQPVHCQMSWTKPSEQGHPCVVYRRVTHGWWMGRRAP